MKRIAALLCFILLLAAPMAQACSPAPGYINKTFRDKISEAEVTFIGTVEEAADDHTTFRIGAPGKASSEKGETMTFKHQMYGTCGGHTFKSGEVWLFAGDGPFAPTRQVDAADMEAAFDEVVERIAQAEEKPAPQPETP